MSNLDASWVRMSAMSEYACMAVLELSIRFDSGNPVSVEEIASSQGIPATFLGGHIMSRLAGAGIVVSRRGPGGGFRLARHPSQISLWDVIYAIEIDRHSKTAPMLGAAHCLILGKIETISNASMNALREITFSELADEYHGLMQLQKLCSA